MVVVIDYGMGNVGSVSNMLRKLGAEARLSAKATDFAVADRFILPGVGSFDAGMRNLAAMPGYDVLCRRVLEDEIPILGICLGMQLFSKSSEEGQLSGLGWIDAETVRIQAPAGHQVRLPHMGWNITKSVRPSPLFPIGMEPQRYYFVHSYHVVCHDEQDVLAKTHHGVWFTSSLCRGSILGVQFHPEKSHRYGLALFERFLHWVPATEAGGP